VADAEGGRWPATWPAPPNGLPRGRLLAAAQVVGTPGEKQELGRRHGALAVDMETAAGARACVAQGVPFGFVRAIPDRADGALAPGLVGLLAGGRVAPGRVLAALARSPRLAVELWRLARDTRRAARRLGRALAELLTPPAILASEASGPPAFLLD